MNQQKKRKNPKRKCTKKKNGENQEKENLQFEKNFTNSKIKISKEKAPQVDQESKTKDKNTLLQSDNTKNVNTEHFLLIGKVEPQSQTPSETADTANTNPTQSVNQKRYPSNTSKSVNLLGVQIRYVGVNSPFLMWHAGQG